MLATAASHSAPRAKHSSSHGRRPRGRATLALQVASAALHLAAVVVSVLVLVVCASYASGAPANQNLTQNTPHAVHTDR